MILDTPETLSAVAVRQKDNDWVAPGLWRSEFRNILMLYIRRADMTLEQARDAVTKGNKIIRGRAVSTQRVLELAANSGCTAYDCEFVSLAERLRLPLVTNDKQVLKAFPAIATTMADFIAS